MHSLYARQYEVDLSQLSRFEGPPESASNLESCIICFEALGPTSSLRQLPCKHTFHQPCIDNWICNQDTKCPLCRETFYYLRRPRQEKSPDTPSSENRHGTFDSLKHWCKKRLNRQTQVATTTTAVQQ